MPDPVPPVPAPGQEPGTPDGTPGSPYAARPWLASYAEGVPADFDFPVVPLTRLLDDAAASFPGTTALAYCGARTSYKDLKDAVDRFATALAGLGVRAGDRVAVLLPSCPQHVLTFFAALRLGAVVVALDPAMPEALLHRRLQDCGARVAVCLDTGAAQVRQARAGTAVQHLVVTALSDYLPFRTRVGGRLSRAAARRPLRSLAPVPAKDRSTRSFLGLLKAAGVPARQARLDPETAPAVLQYAGASARAVQLTHANLVADAYMARLWDTTAVPGAEVVLGVVPLWSPCATTAVLTSTVLVGGTLVLLPRPGLQELLDAVDTWSPTVLPGVPAVYEALVASPLAGRHDLSALRLCVSGGGSLAPSVRAQVERLTGCRVVEGHAVPEASPATHSCPTTAPARPGSIGLPLPGTRCRVVDRTDPSREVPVGQPGLLAVAGPQLPPGGRGAPARADGFLVTGEVAVMDADGWFHLVDQPEPARRTA